MIVLGMGKYQTTHMFILMRFIFIYIAWKMDLKYDMLRDVELAPDILDGKQLGRCISYIIMGFMSLFFSISVL